MRIKTILGSLLCLNLTNFSMASEPLFSDIKSATQTLNRVYSITTSDQRNWDHLTAIEIVDDLRIWGEHFCKTGLETDKALATQCFQLIEFYLTGGFGIDTEKEQTSQDQLSMLRAVSSAIYYRDYLLTSFFSTKPKTSSENLGVLKEIDSMCVIAEAAHSLEPAPSEAFSPLQCQWLEYLKVNQWLLSASLKDPLTICLSVLPFEGCIPYFGTPNPGVDQPQEENNGFMWLSNFYVSGESNANSSLQEDKGTVLVVNYRDHKLQAFSVETLYHLHKMILAKKFDSLEEAQLFSALTPNESQKKCRGLVKKTEYDEQEIDKHMFLLLKQKYFNNSKLAKAFLEIKNCLLFEGNKWGDSDWGAAFTSSDEFRGANKLGKMLVRVREELVYEYATNSSFRKFIEGTNPFCSHIFPPTYPEIVFQ